MCAGYALYGSATMVVLSLGKESGVNGFMLDPVSLYLLASFWTRFTLSINEFYKIYVYPVMIEDIRCQ